MRVNKDILKIGHGIRTISGLSVQVCSMDYNLHGEGCVLALVRDYPSDVGTTDLSVLYSYDGVAIAEDPEFNLVFDPDGGVPCFVRVDSMKERKELFDWLRAAGINVWLDEALGNFALVVCNKTIATPSPLYNREGLVSNGFVDCGEDIEMFKRVCSKSVKDNQDGDLQDNYQDKDGSVIFDEGK